jgi:hypothetical protein
MPFLNGLIKIILLLRYRSFSLLKKDPFILQKRVFFYLVRKSKKTYWGKKYHYNNILSKNSFEESLLFFKKNVPISRYEDLFHLIDKSCQGEKDVLWPGKFKWAAKSSGTTNDKSKLIPMSKESLRGCHYKGGKEVLSFYVKANRGNKVFSGKTLIVGGSFSSEHSYDDLLVGDLSAILFSATPSWAKRLRSPSAPNALISDWEQKVEIIARESIKENIVALAGVPSWALVILNKVLDISGKKSILDVWPNLELFIHGGVSFYPYKNEFKKIIPNDKMNYLETYNASEGFFALMDDLERDDMLLLLNNGIFYEFIELSEVEKKDPRTILASQLELGKTYALVISTNSGLWRYLIGDTIVVTSVDPIRIKVAGRTKHFINVFGEELMVSNTDKAIDIACNRVSVGVKDYTVAPVFMEGGSRGGHQWLIEFYSEPSDMNLFSKELDKALKSLNSDYEAKRHKDLVLLPPSIVVARKDLFYSWLKKKNKLGGQNKVPRLSNEREFIEELLRDNF